MKQESMDLESQASLDYAEGIARITPKRRMRPASAQGRQPAHRRGKPTKQTNRKEKTMNTENETRTTIYHPAPSGKGSAIRFALHPAHGNVSGCVICEIAKQKTLASVTGETPTAATFDWDGAIAVKLCVSDLAQMLMVFRGMQESIEDGKGLFHHTATANAVIRFSHVIEPRPGYLFSVSKKPFDGELTDAFFVFRPEEAIWFSVALEGAMPALVFGVPSVGA